jgi:hypothetical protein
MIPLEIFTIWQRLAVFDPMSAARFDPIENRVKKNAEVMTFSRWLTSVCQNRYPSPSRWPVQRYLGGSPWFCKNRKIAADFKGRLTNVIATLAELRLSSRMGVFPKLNTKGNKLCKRPNRFSYSPYLSALPLAMRSTQIWNAPLSVLRSAVWQAKCLSMANASKARLLAVPSASLPTDKSTTGSNGNDALVNLGRPGIGRLGLFFADTARPGAFVIAYQAVKTLFVSQGSTHNKNRGTSKCKNHSSLSRPLWVWPHVAKAQILNAQPLVALLAVWQAILSTKAIALSVLPSAQPLALCRTTSTSDFCPHRASYFTNNADGARFRAPFGVAKGHLSYV